MFSEISPVGNTSETNGAEKITPVMVKYYFYCKHKKLRERGKGKINATERGDAAILPQLRVLKKCFDTFKSIDVYEVVQQLYTAISEVAV